MRLNAVDETGRSPFHKIWEVTAKRYKAGGQFSPLFEHGDLDLLADAAVRTTLHRRTPQMEEAAREVTEIKWLQDHLKHRWGSAHVFRSATAQRFFTDTDLATDAELSLAITLMFNIAIGEINLYERMNGEFPYVDSDFCEQAIDPSK